MGLFLSKYSKFEKTLPDVSGKVFAITGTTSGTGFVAAQTVAQHNGVVLLLNRPSSRSVESLKKLQAAVPEGKFVPIDCDLQDFASVRKAIAEIKEKYTSLYCLSNNAGIMATPDEITNDGYDKQMQTNHLSHFLLTKELFPLLLASSKEHGDARIVQHSSLGRHGTIGNILDEKYLDKYEKDGMLGGDVGGRPYNGPDWQRYYQTKLANSVFCQALHHKLVGNDDDRKNILSLAAHPGMAFTNLGDHLTSLTYKVLFSILGFFCSNSGGRYDGAAQGDDGQEGKRRGRVPLRTESFIRIRNQGHQQGL
jgi:NAD(P)-dependent dehydrogenase (short-subunit alcohol dehydrogenase family)